LSNQNPRSSNFENPICFGKNNFVDSYFIESNLLAKDVEGALSIYNNCIEELVSYVFNAAEWIDSVVYSIVFLNDRDNSVRSRSSGSRPSLIGLCTETSISHLSTLIIHEAAHQHFYLTTLVKPICNGKDFSEYYSPFRKKTRPLYFILLAAHAAINIRIFIHAYLGSTINTSNKYLVLENNSLKNDTDIMLNQIYSMAGLTKSGISLFSSLLKKNNEYGYL